MEKGLLNIVKWLIYVYMSFIIFAPPIISRIVDVEVMSLPFKFVRFNKGYNLEFESLDKVNKLEPSIIAIPTLENLQKLLRSSKTHMGQPPLEDSLKELKEDNAKAIISKPTFDKTKKLPKAPQTDARPEQPTGLRIAPGGNVNIVPGGNVNIVPGEEKNQDEESESKGPTGEGVRLEGVRIN